MAVSKFNKYITDPIIVVGAGYVGLSSAVFLATKGCKVHVTETNPLVVDSLKQGKLHFQENELQRRLRTVVKQGRISFSAPSRKYYLAASLIIIAIDSANQGKWKMKLKAFDKMIDWIGAQERKQSATVVLKSTNVLGFADRIQEMIYRTPSSEKIRLVEKNTKAASIRRTLGSLWRSIIYGFLIMVDSILDPF